MRRPLLLVFLLLSSACDDSAPAAPVCTASGACEEDVPVTSALHVPGDIDYPDPPPAGGNHNPCWAKFGVATTELRPENWVHNLEHGAVVFLYHCPAGCDAEIADLGDLAAGKAFAVVTAYSDLPARFAVVSWGHRLVTDDYDRAAFEQFYDVHRDNAPESETANPPSSCIVP